MLALRFLLLLTFIGTNGLAFEYTAAFSFTEPSHYKSADIDFNEDNSTLLNIPNLRIESFQLHSNESKPKVAYGSKQGENSTATIEQLKIGFQYLKYSKTVALKLASFSISFPFHSFP